MKKWIAQSMLILAGTGLIGANAFAHTDEMLATMKAPHGGQLKMAGPYHLELVVKPGLVEVYVTDHGDKQIASQGGRGSVTLLSGGKKTLVKLSPAGGNLLQGKGSFQIKPDMKAVVSVMMPGQPAQQARFEPGKKKDHAGHDHAH